MASTRYVVVEVDDAAVSSSLADLLLVNGYDRISILKSIWNHPELRYSAPPDNIINRWTSNAANKNQAVRVVSNRARETHSIGDGYSHSDKINAMSSQQRLELLMGEKPVQLNIKPDPHTDDSHRPSQQPAGDYNDYADEDVDVTMTSSVSDVLRDPRLFPSVSDGGTGSERKSTRARIPSRKRRSSPPDEEGHVLCELCRKHVPIKSANLRKHVQRNHCELKSYVCPHCPYSHERPMVRSHIMARHVGSNSEPVDMRDRKMYEVWNTLMKKCFPTQFADVEWAIPHWQTAAGLGTASATDGDTRAAANGNSEHLGGKEENRVDKDSEISSTALLRLFQSDNTEEILSEDLRAIPPSAYRIHEDMDWHSYQPKKRKQLPPEQQHGYTCEKCKRQVHCQQNRVMFLRYHVINIHSDYKPFNCSECDRGAATRCQVRIHINKCHARTGNVLENRTAELEAHWDTLVMECFPSRFEAMNVSDECDSLQR